MGRGRETGVPLSMVYDATAGGTVSLLACTIPIMVILVPIARHVSASDELRYIDSPLNEMVTAEPAVEVVCVVK